MINRPEGDELVVVVDVVAAAAADVDVVADVDVAHLGLGKAARRSSRQRPAARASPNSS